LREFDRLVIGWPSELKLIDSFSVFFVVFFFFFLFACGVGVGSSWYFRRTLETLSDPNHMPRDEAGGHPWNRALRTAASRWAPNRVLHLDIHGCATIEHPSEQPCDFVFCATEAVRREDPSRHPAASRLQALLLVWFLTSKISSAITSIPFSPCLLYFLINFVL
jgi:hypothetical protein